MYRRHPLAPNTTVLGPEHDRHVAPLMVFTHQRIQRCIFAWYPLLSMRPPAGPSCVHFQRSSYSSPSTGSIQCKWGFHWTAFDPSLAPCLLPPPTIWQCLWGLAVLLWAFCQLAFHFAISFLYVHVPINIACLHFFFWNTDCRFTSTDSRMARSRLYSYKFPEGVVAWCLVCI